MLMLSIGLVDLIPICAWRSAPPVGVRRLAIDREINLRRLGAPDDVVHDQRRLVAVQVGELKGLVIDQDQDRLLRGEEGAQAGLGGDGLGHRRHSGLGLRSSRPGYRRFIAP